MQWDLNLPFLIFLIEPLVKKKIKIIMKKFKQEKSHERESGFEFRLSILRMKFLANKLFGKKRKEVIFVLILMIMSKRFYILALNSTIY
jgi:hypothetical protein